MFDVFDNLGTKIISSTNIPFTITGLNSNTVYTGYFILDSFNNKVTIPDFKTQIAPSIVGSAKIDESEVI